MNALRKWITMAGLLLGLSACGSVQNTSLLDGANDFGRAQLNVYPVRVLAIDKNYPIDVNPVRVEPGVHVLRISAPPPHGFRESVEKDIPFTVEACKRYYLAAKRENPLMRDWELQVQQVEERGDCKKQP